MKTKICGYEWYIHFCDPKEIEGCDGRTYAGSFEIKIASGLNLVQEKLVLTHEVSHAIIGCSALWYQKQFDEEFVCEFTAYHLDEINRIVAEWQKEREND